MDWKVQIRPTYAPRCASRLGSPGCEEHGDQSRTSKMIRTKRVVGAPNTTPLTPQYTTCFSQQWNSVQSDKASGLFYVICRE